MRNKLIIVTGLPRSGTSLMMQILQAGGIPVICDNNRQADKSNPRGYFEDSRVNRLDIDNRWLLNHPGNAVKITTHWLPFIPEGLPAKIIFMKRDPDEIIVSQNKMLAEHSESISPHRLKSAFLRQVEKTIDWIEKQKSLSCILVDHINLIESAKDQIQQISLFLEWELSNKAVQVIRQDLYRSK